MAIPDSSIPSLLITCTRRAVWTCPCCGSRQAKLNPYGNNRLILSLPAHRPIPGGQHLIVLQPSIRQSVEHSLECHLTSPAGLDLHTPDTAPPRSKGPCVRITSITRSKIMALRFRVGFFLLAPGSSKAHHQSRKFIPLSFVSTLT